MEKLLQALQINLKNNFLLFLDLIHSLSKLAKDVVMRITEKNVYFIISEEDSGPRRPLVWCVLPVSFYFKEYNFAGVSSESNEIFLEFSTGKNCSDLLTFY